MKILVGADFVPTRSNSDLFSISNTDSLFGKELTDILTAADYKIFNLEVPLVNGESAIEKVGPSLIAPTETVAAYRSIGVNALALANNHILDQGTRGLEFTMKTLAENQISFFGAGKTPQDAAAPLIFEVDGKKIGVYACVEHEFSVVSEATSGANPFDPMDSPDHIFELKKQCDYVIALYHGGKEHYRYPSPQLQKVCRKLVDKGANLVVCQHSHCVGCEEKYNDSTIVYGQGNFLFDMLDNEYWNSSVLIQIEDDFSISYIPIIKCGNGVRLAQGEVAGDILAGFNKRSEEILDVEFLNENYGKFAENYRSHYISIVNGRRSFLFRALNKLTKGKYSSWYFGKKYTRQHLLAIKNVVECEAHRELFLRTIDDK